MKKEKLLGVNVLITDYEQIANEIVGDITKNEKKFIVAINPEKVVKANEDELLTKILNDADYPIPDGRGIVFASKLKGGNIKKRITGIDCMLLLCDKFSKMDTKIFLYGSKQYVVEKTKQRLEEKYPGINIVGISNGYINDNDSLIKKINESNADVLFVALGSPKQEYWIYENMSKLNAKIFQGVGGSFDVISGNVKRAPLWMQKTGLEWLYRLIKQPFRIKIFLIFSKYLSLILKKEK